MPAGRPKGSPNRPGSQKPGRKTGQHRMPTMTDDEILDSKYKIIELLLEGKAVTISDAARQLELSPAQVYSWGKTDPDFTAAIKSVREVVADDLEVKLRTHNNFIPQMFALKAYRPEFRDNARIDYVDSKLGEILNELKQAGQKKPDVKTEEKNAT